MPAKVSSRDWSSVRVAGWRGWARSAEGQQDGGAGDAGVGGDGQGVAGVIVEPGQDLGAGAAGEWVVGEVGLPALVRHVRLEPDAGRLRPLGRGGSDQPGPGQVPADGGGRHRQLVVVLQVPGDGVRSGVQALPGKVCAQPMIRSAVSSLIADGEVLGRRDRGSNAASPSLAVPGQQRVNPGRATP
jgi:hypothetical protein